jgi:hypothetical protein
MSVPIASCAVLTAAFWCVGAGFPEIPGPGHLLATRTAAAVMEGGGQTTLVRCQTASIVTGDGTVCRDFVVTNPNLPSTGSSITVSETFADGSVQTEVLGPGDQRSFHCCITSIKAHETVAPRSTVAWSW